MEVVKLIEEAKKSLVQKAQETFNRDGDYIYLHQLLQCPLKTELESKYGELLEPEKVNEIVDGFLTEDFLTRSSGTSMVNNYLFVSGRAVDGKRIATHVDLFSESLALEIKTPTFTFPRGEVPVEKEYYTDEEADLFSIPENYLLQARLQCLLLRDRYPDIEYFLAVKTTAKVYSPDLMRVRMKKVWIVKKVQPLTEEEFEEVIRDYLERKEKKLPKWEWECRYCPFYRNAMCEGRQKEEAVNKEEVLRLYAEYLRKKEELANLENTLRLMLKGRSVQMEGRTIGYVERESVKWNVEKLKEVCEKDELCRFVTINWRRHKEIEEVLKAKGLEPEEFRERQVRKEFKL